MSDHEDETITAENAPLKNIPQITTNIVLKGNSAKSMTTDNDGNLKIHPPITAEEHQQVQREEKARTILLSALPDEHMDDFYHMIDARDIWNAIKARFDAKDPDSNEHLKIKPDPEDINMKFLRGLPSSWSGIALILKTKGGLEYISFDDLYNKLKFLEIDTKGNQEMVAMVAILPLSASHGFSSSKGSSKSKCSVVDDVIYSFFANHEIDQQLVYEDLDQMNKEEFKEYDLKHQMAMLSIKDRQTEEGNTEPRSLENFGMVAGLEIASDADSEGEVVFADDAIPVGVSISASDVVVAIVSPHSETEFALMGLSTKVSIPVTCPLCCESKYKLIKKDYQGQREQLNDCIVDLKAHKHAVKSLEKQIKCHQTNQLAYEEKIRVLLYELEEKTNILEYRQKLIDQAT
nr:hypothetical protein [Tanacetum cinerariifolium]